MYIENKPKKVLWLLWLKLDIETEDYTEGLDFTVFIP